MLLISSAAIQKWVNWLKTPTHSSRSPEQTGLAWRPQGWAARGGGHLWSSLTALAWQLICPWIIHTTLLWSQSPWEVSDSSPLYRRGSWGSERARTCPRPCGRASWDRWGLWAWAPSQSSCSQGHAEDIMVTQPTHPVWGLLLKWGHIWRSWDFPLPSKPFSPSSSRTLGLRFRQGPLGGEAVEEPGEVQGEGRAYGGVRGEQTALGRRCCPS